ncbi:MAG TPA: hypothetical protein VF168_00810 [Trueperaceae bacterium]
MTALLLAACNGAVPLPPDTLPPVLEVATPVEGSLLGRDRTAVFRGFVVDDREVATVRLLDGQSGAQLAAGSVGPRGGGADDRRDWMIEWRAEGSGERALAVEAKDSAGNSVRFGLSVVVADVWFPDVDSDGYGDPEAALAALEAPDGYVGNAGDCDDGDGAINPDAVDEPDLGFVDVNCDGFDGQDSGTLFVSPLGNDSNPGTRSSPLATPSAAIGVGRSRLLGKIVIAAGTYPVGSGLEVLSDFRLYGGYDPSDWSRSTDEVTRLVGEGQGVLLRGGTDVLLQLMTIEGSAGSDSLSVYALRATGGSVVTLEAVDIVAGDALDGSDGQAGAAGNDGGDGGWGDDGGSGDEWYLGLGGYGGYAYGTFEGGDGGDGGYEGGEGADGYAGEGGGGSGGLGGFGSYSCGRGGNGSDGLPGSAGSAGIDGGGGLNVFDYASTEWQGDDGEPGTGGTDGSGGGGGGGGGGHGDYSGCGATGNGGGGGGASGAGGSGGQGGKAGGGSFGIYIWDSSVVIAGPTSITTGNGGDGGDGGAGGSGGIGGDGGAGGDCCNGTVAIGGDGGRGGNGGSGGAGGGAAGGPSIGIFLGGSGTLSGSGNVTFSIGAAGKGGTSPRWQGEEGTAARTASP